MCSIKPWSRIFRGNVAGPARPVHTLPALPPNTPAHLLLPGPISPGGPRSLPLLITLPDKPGRPPASDHVSRRDDPARSGLQTSHGICPVTYRPGDHVTEAMTFSSGTPITDCFVPVLTNVRCQCSLDYATRASHLTCRFPVLSLTIDIPLLGMSVYPAT